MKCWLIVPLLLIGFASAALAQEDASVAPIGLVPGKPAYWDWSGFYVGGQFGMASAVMDPGDATKGMVHNILRGTTLENEEDVSGLVNLPQATTSRIEFGGFGGYNSQWDDVVLGFELNYNTGGTMNTASSDYIGRSFTPSDGYRYDVTVDSHTKVALKDYATARFRAGYVMGRFLPYAMVGAAVGRADVSRSTTVTVTGVDAASPPVLPPVSLGPTTATDSQNDAILYGIDAGAGLDVAITPNIFLRAEYEYLYFFPFKQTKISVNTGRVGVGFKF